MQSPSIDRYWISVKTMQSPFVDRILIHSNDDSATLFSLLRLIGINQREDRFVTVYESGSIRARMFCSPSVDQYQSCSWYLRISTRLFIIRNMVCSIIGLFAVPWTGTVLIMAPLKHFNHHFRIIIIPVQYRLTESDKIINDEKEGWLVGNNK